MEQKSISFTLNLDPVATARPRMTRKGHTYTPEKTRSFKQSVYLLSMKYAPLKPWQGPLKLQVIFYMRKPKSLKITSPYHIKRPDTDNLIKGVKDAMSLFWIDDAQICIEHTTKLYALNNDPCIVVAVSKL